MSQYTESRTSFSSAALLRYISAIGAALIAAFFDFVRNSELSAVTKTAISIKEQLQLTGSTGGASIAAILIFGAIGAILVCAYQPRETKEAFLLGLTVLVVAGLGVPPAIPRSKVGSEIPTRHGLLPISTAHAQAAEIPNEQRRIWLFLDGPGQRQIPEVRVMVYSGADGRLLSNSLVYTKFSIVVPAGISQIEISRHGYRNVSFKVKPSQENAAYRVPLRETGLLSAANFLGPEAIRLDEDPGLTNLLASSVNHCQQHNPEAAADFAKQAELRKEKVDRDTRRLLCL